MVTPLKQMDAKRRELKGKTKPSRSGAHRQPARPAVVSAKNLNLHQLGAAVATSYRLARDREYPALVEAALEHFRPRIARGEFGDMNTHPDAPAFVRSGTPECELLRKTEGLATDEARADGWWETISSEILLKWAVRRMPIIQRSSGLIKAIIALSEHEVEDEEEGGPASGAASECLAADVVNLFLAQGGRVSVLADSPNWKVE
jgi:hypothetical protein